MIVRGFRGWCWVSGCYGVFVYTVDEALDDAESNEAADVNVGELSTVLEVPLFDALALLETGVEFNEADAVDELGLGGMCVCGSGGVVVGDCSWSRRRGSAAAGLDGAGARTWARGSTRAAAGDRDLAGATGCERLTDWGPDGVGIVMRGIPRGQGGRGSGDWRGKDGVDVTGAFLLHFFVRGNCGAELGGWGIDG